MATAKKTTGPSAAVIDAASRAAGLQGYKIKRLVTLPLWKWQDGVEKFFKSLSPIRIGRAMSDRRTEAEKAEGKAKGKGPLMEPAHIMAVLDLENNRECEIIVGAVLKGNLEENYPNESYVGKCFASIQSKVEGKRYRQYTLTELEPE